MKGKTLTRGLLQKFLQLWPDQGGYAMVIQHNMNAMNTSRQLGLATKHLSKSSEKPGRHGGMIHTEPYIPLIGAELVDFEPLKISDLKSSKDGYLYCVGPSGFEMYAMYTDPHFINGVTQKNQPLIFATFDEGILHVADGTARFITAADLGAAQPDTWTRTQYYYSSNDGTGIHAGASSSQTDKISVPMVNATCKGLGITELTTATEKNATRALKLLDHAVTRASAYRSAFGAVQNRLEHAQKIDGNTSWNTQAAESQIRDTDMAAEMVQYSNVSILHQAGQSMLAQANQNRQLVLNLVA